MRTLALLVLCCSFPLARAAEVDYLRQVKPILEKHCYACHGPDKQRAGLRLDTVAAALRGGDGGPAIVPGKSKDSRLIKAVLGLDDLKPMPPKEPRLTSAEVAILRAWIDAGAKAPANETAQTNKSKHWAFVGPVRPAIPEVKTPAWSRNPIDRFILARLEKAGLKPSAEADRVTLIRRVTLDLIGLPPTPGEVEAFVNDPRPDAYERLVERLLASPHYGERWGRIWLDAARYGDSHGFTIDGMRTIWPYRDWVIKAINADMPFDRFTVEQLAGDMLPNATLDQKVATGFHRNTLFNQEGGIDQEQFRTDYVVDRVNTTGTVWLGLTIGCAQCHSHKYDPISHREYYQLFAFFNNCDEPTLDLATPDQEAQRKAINGRIAALDRLRKISDKTSPKGQLAWEKGLSTESKLAYSEEIQVILNLDPASRDARQKEKLADVYRKNDWLKHVGSVVGTGHPLNSLGQLAVLDFRAGVETQINDLKKRLPQVATTLVLKERATPRPTHILLGGDFTRKGEPVTPGVPAVLPSLDKEKPTRLDLARWLVQPRNPLTARVTVNRHWQHFFGLGLVETENDFGTQGEKPTHPELLDWLATEFVRQGWSMKSLHRLLVTSATYCQSSVNRPELARIDARNRLLARQSRLRLDAELVRDAALAASGLLSRKIGGPSVFPPQPKGVYAFTQVQKDWKVSTGPDRYRRGLYTWVWRSAPHPGLTSFDAPDGNVTCTRRNRSNTPLQALTLLNDEAFVESARALAARVVREAPTPGERLGYLFRLCLARKPSEREARILAGYFAGQKEKWQQAPATELGKLLPEQPPAGVPAPEFVALTMTARVIMNLDEFISRE